MNEKNRAPARSGRRARRLRRRRFFGNQIWKTHVDGRAVLQKLYLARASSSRVLLERVARRKSTSRPHDRCATERSLLALWRRHGFDVPEDLTDVVNSQGGGPVLVLEYVHGELLSSVLRNGRLGTEPLGPERRADLLRRFSREWGRRHRLALDLGEPGLVQEHANLGHVIVSDERLVTIDLEQAFRDTDDVLRLVAKEVTGYLRSLAKSSGDARFPQDLGTVVGAYPDRSILESATREYLHSGRTIWWLDRHTRADRRRRYGKYGTLEELERQLVG